jgi:hypothetical protein
MDYQQLLREYDDSTHWEYPPSFDYRAATIRFKKFADELSATLGVPLTTETGSYIQDASFHSQLLVPLAGGRNTLIRFSNFGNMVTISEDEPAPEEMLSTIKRLFDRYGYVYVPASVLEQPYRGSNPGVTGIDTWWIRYFDWV